MSNFASGLSLHRAQLWRGGKEVTKNGNRDIRINRFTKRGLVWLREIQIFEQHGVVNNNNKIQI